MKKLLLIVLLSMSASQVFASNWCAPGDETCNSELPISSYTPVSRLDKCVTYPDGIKICEG